jgi:hypothetical protein
VLSLPFPEGVHEPSCGDSISLTLHKNVDNEAVLIDGAPEALSLARNRDVMSSICLLSPRINFLNHPRTQNESEIEVGLSTDIVDETSAF